MSGFNTINKYKQINKEQGITSAKNSAESAVLTGLLASQKMDVSVFDAAALYAETPDNGASSSSDEYKMNGAQKWAIASTALTGLAQIAGNLFASNAAGNSFFKKSEGNSDISNATENIKTIKTSNDLADAIQDYSKKASSKHSANLTKELSQAKADKSNFANLVVEQDSLVKNAEKEKQSISNGMKELETDKNKKQTAVDTIKGNLVKAAEAEITKLNNDDIAQDKTIEASQNRVVEAKAECEKTVTAQNTIISQQTPNLNAMKTETITGADGSVSTRQVPDTQKRENAKKAIDDAKKAIDDANKKKEDVIKDEETGEESVQGKAKAAKIEIAQARASQEAIKQNPSSEELTAAKEACAKAIETLNEQQTKLNSFDNTIKEATAKKNKANQEMVALSQTIMNAEALLAKGQPKEDK